jgi:hypothetical protein
MERVYIGMREVSVGECLDEEFVAQQALQHHLAAQAAMDGRRIKKAEIREWIVAGVGLALLVASLGALLVANAADVWR